jgi:hypothetical protein
MGGDKATWKGIVNCFRERRGYESGGFSWVVVRKTRKESVCRPGKKPLE